MAVVTRLERHRRLTLRWVASPLLVALGVVVLSPLPSGGAYPPHGSTEQVSVASDGTEGNGQRPSNPFSYHGSNYPSISDDGRYVAFNSASSNLVAGDTNETLDVFVYDREARTTERVSILSDGSQAAQRSVLPAISGDGRHVAFLSLDSLDARYSCPCNSGLYVHDRETGITELISVSSDGTRANQPVEQRPSISADGRYVAFSSRASNLVLGDTNIQDVFVHDRETGTTELVSVASDGTQGSNTSEQPAISGDGRHVAFKSSATNLVENDANRSPDVFVHDREAGTTELVSVSSVRGEPPTDPPLTFAADNRASSTDSPAISADGRYVAFRSNAFNIVPVDHNKSFDVFVRDRNTGITQRVSVASDGSEGNSESSEPAISADGRYVAFRSSASNIVADDTNEWPDIFVYDREAGIAERVSVASDGTQSNDDSGQPSISADGRYVAFGSFAATLAPGRTNTAPHSFVRDRGRAPGLFGEPTLGAAQGSVAITGRARFPGIVLAEAEDGLSDVPDAAQKLGAELTSAAIVYRPEEEDLLIRVGVESFPDYCAGELDVVAASCVARDRAPGQVGNSLVAPCSPNQNTGDICPREGGVPGVVYGFGLRAGSNSFEVRVAAASVSSNYDGLGFPYAGLYRCSSESCVETAALGGSMGYTGNEILASVPLAHLGITEAQPRLQLTSLRAFATVGEAPQAVLPVPLDEVELAPVLVRSARVELGLAPLATPEEQVSYDGVAELVNGRFDGRIPVVGRQNGDYRLWARACVAESCGEATTSQLTLGPKPSPSPTLTPSPSVSPSPSPSSSSSPSPNPSPSPSPSVSPSPLPLPSVSPSPSPTPGPSPTPPMPSAEMHERTLILKPRPLSHRGVAKGRVKLADGGPRRCAKKARIRVQYRPGSGGGWRTARALKADKRGRYKARPILKHRRPRPGDYRAIAPQLEFRARNGTDVICARAVSVVWKLRL